MFAPGEPAAKCVGRRPAGYFYRDPLAPEAGGEHDARGVWQDLPLVNMVRERVKAWRTQWARQLVFAATADQQAHLEAKAIA